MAERSASYKEWLSAHPFAPGQRTGDSDVCRLVDSAEKMQLSMRRVEVTMRRTAEAMQAFGMEAA